MEASAKTLDLKVTTRKIYLMAVKRKYAVFYLSQKATHLGRNQQLMHHTFKSYSAHFDYLPSKRYVSLKTKDAISA
jgi:hypothetical protein